MSAQKTPKKRADKYEEKLAVKGTFEQLLGVALSNTNIKTAKTNKPQL